MDFHFLSTVQNDVNEGKITGGPLDMGTDGKGILLDFDTESINGNDYFVFWLTRPGAVGYRKAQIRIPKSTDKESAKYMGFQNISKTVFGCVRANAKTDRIDQVIQKIKTILATKSIELQYKGSYNDFINQRTGKSVKGWNLDELIGLGPIEKIPFVRPAPGADMNPGPTSAFGFDPNVPF